MPDLTERVQRARKDCVCPDCGETRQVRRDKPSVRRCGSCSRREVALRTGRQPPRRRRTFTEDERHERKRVENQQYNARRAAQRASTRHRLFVTGRCPECGEWFTWVTASDHGDLARFCSDVCRSRHRGKGKNRPAITTAQRKAVFERDRWVCQICKKPTARTKAWPHPRSPVVDHVIPLAAGPDRGGVHAPHNWQTAHAECNHRKHDDCDQLALFGVA